MERKDCTIDIYTVDALDQFMLFDLVVCKEFDNAVQECARHHSAKVFSSRSIDFSVNMPRMGIKK
jgi:hypothetical protein